MTTIKITALTDIGANIPNTTLIPVVDMTGTPTTDKATFGNVANAILSQAGNNYSAATKAVTVTASAQPNITSVGTLTALSVTGNVTANIYFGDGGFLSNVTGGNATPGGSNSQVQYNDNGAFGGDPGMTYNEGNSTLTANNFIATSNSYLGNISTTGSASITTLLVGATANLGAVGNVTITGGTAGQVLSTNGNGVLSWASDATTYGNSNVVSLLSAFGSNTITTTGNISGGNVLTSANVIANGIIDSGTGLTTGGYLSVDGNTDLHNTVVTGNLSATGNITATNLGNISAINLTGSNSNVLYGNGVFAPAAGGGSSSELVNGNNSLVLDGDGNIVLEGTPSGNAINRGLVWDYGANANGVNSTLRQDNGGLILRAWTENGGGANGYSAPVSIVTNQDAAAKSWEFDGQGNLTVPTGSINSINDGGDLGAYITLTPDLGIARLAARDAQSNVNYTNTSWTSGTYTGTQVDFVDAPNLVTFFNNNSFNDGVNQTFSINGGEPVPFTGYSIGASNAVTVYTSITAEPDPTTVANINFFSQFESYVSVDYDGGELNINATGLDIIIDNDQTEGTDIVLRSGDDISLQAKDMSVGSEREGGDINLNAGDGADDDGLGNTASGGGDIIIDAGIGGDGNSSSGGTGGFTQIRGGRGGTAGVTNLAGGGGYVEIAGGDGGFNNSNTALGASGGDVNIYGGDTTREGFNGADVNLTSGAGGPNAFAGSVNISTPSSDSGPGGLWQFDGNGLLTLPDGAIIDTIGNNFEVRAVENVNFEANAVVNIYTDGSNNAYQWQFGDDGLLTLPGGNVQIGNQFGSQAILATDEAFGVVSQGANAFTLLQWSDSVSNTSQLSGIYVNAPLAVPGDIHIRTGDVLNPNVWAFTNDGNLVLPGNTFAVNYANGTQVSIGGGSGNTGNVTFDDNIVIGTGDEYGFSGLYLAVGPDSIANGTVQYLRVRGGDAPTHIHLDTGNNQFYDQYFGDDAKYVKLELGDAGNVVVGTDDAAGNSYNWTFTSGGNFILANGNSVIQSIANSSLDPTLPNVSTMVLTPDANYNSQVLVLDPTAPGHIHLRAYAFSNIDEPAANIFLGGEDTAFEITSGANNQAVIHSNGKAWTFGDDGNISSDTLTFTTTFANVKTVEYQTAGVWDLYVEDSITGSNTASSRLNVSFKDNLIDKPQVYIENTKESDGIALRWTFDENGNLNFPRDVAGNSDPYLNIFGGSTPTIQSTDVSLAGPANLAIQSDYLNLSGFTGNRIILQADAGAIATDANIVLSTNLADLGNVYSWTLDTTGNLTLPGNTFAINYANGAQVSLGGGANTGNIIFDQSTIESNQSNAYINLNASGSGTLSLGTNDQSNVRIVTDEGNVNNQWTFGTDGILTLPQGSQIGETANVSTNITANGRTWAFDVNGNLTLPGNIVTPNGANAVIPSTAGTAGAPLIISAGTGGIAATSLNAGNGGNLTINAGDAGSDIGNPSWGAIGGTLVLRAGNSTQPYTGSNVEIRSGNSASIPGAISLYTGANQWTFDATGNLTVPGSLINNTSMVLSAPSIFNICTIATAGSGYNTGSSLKATTGGSGSGMTVGIGYGLSNQLTSVNVVNPGTGYVNGDVITVSEGTGGTFVLTKYNQSANQTNNNTIQTDFTFANSTVTLPIYGEMATDASMTLTTNLANTGNTRSWTFGDDGNLTIPGSSGGFIKTVSNASIGIVAMDNGTNNPAQLLSMNAGTGAATSIISAYATNATIQTNAAGNINTWQFDNAGNLTLPTGGQIIVSGGLVSSGASPAPTINGFSITNSVGISGNGNIAGNNISATGNISANNFTGNGGTLSNVATKVEGSWTLASGVNTVNISVPLNGTYAIWVNGNIPNGIVTYTATGVVTNTNVPVLGEQYGWYYEAGNALVLTSIPNQFVGTQGAISNAAPYSGNTANVFTFGITNNSGNTAVVNYGYTKL